MTDAVERINELQRRILLNEQIPQADMLAAITALRAERGLAAKQSMEKKTATATSRAAANAIDINALFGDPK